MPFFLCQKQRENQYFNFFTILEIFKNMLEHIKIGLPKSLIIMSDALKLLVLFLSRTITSAKLFAVVPRW